MQAKKMQAERRKAIDYAIDILKDHRRRYAISAHGAEYGFIFGIQAQKHVDEINRYIEILEGIKLEGPLL